jgi:hypothetical protein
MRRASISLAIFITLLLYSLDEHEAVMAQPAAPAGRGRKRNPCWGICERPSPFSKNAICSYCSETVAADTTIANTHIVFTCTAIPAEKRAWFKQQLSKGFFDEAVAPEDLPEDKRRKLFKEPPAGGQRDKC